MSEKLGFEADNEEVPPYEESRTATRVLPDSKDLPRPSLHTQLTETRTRRIHNLLATYIEPQLYSHFLDGMYKRAFLLIPSDSLTQQRDLSSKNIVGLPDASNVSVIRLDDDENRAAFWQQPGVLQELTSSLRARLAASGHKVEMPDNSPPETALTSPPADQSEQRASPSWLRKQYGIPGPLHDPTATTNYKLGWRSEEEDLPKSKLGLDEVRVLVKVRDVSFRVETEMGLLDSVTGKVIWLELEVGA
jgi:hypothetical protein